MPHTTSRYMQDLGNPDTKIFVGAQDLIVSGTTVLTRTAAGNWNYQQGVAQAVIYGVNVVDLVARRLGFGEDLQEQYGGTGIPASAQSRVYRGDQLGGMNTGQQLQPRTTFKRKGLKLLSYNVIYGIAVVPLTTHITRVDQTLFVNNVAPAITPVLATGANGLATAVQANPYVTVVTVPGTDYFVSNNGALFIEVAVTTAATGTYVMYGLDILVEYNPN